jgi:threonyl-tRNA synthetase
MITITLSGGQTLRVDPGLTISTIIQQIEKDLSKTAIAALLDGRPVDLSTQVEGDAALTFLTSGDKEGIEILRHSTSHVMAAAVKELFPEVKVAIGPSIENGFYYDFDKPEPFTPEDLKKIEKKMREIISRNHPFERSLMTKAEALEFFDVQGEIYKVEIIKDIPAQTVSIYKSGNFIDLCAGPHVPGTGKIKVFKLLSIAGAYWRGDEKRQMLQRIYGTAFPTQEELDAYLRALDEAAKRDHRKLGRELDLISIHEEEAGPGLIYWHPRGAMMRKIIEDFWKDEHLRRGYSLVSSPHIARVDLWRTSGHWDFYRENMYSPMDIEGQEYVLKPMNCPFHILIYKTHKHSYRELPIRYAELGTVYRYERSGVLHGMLRVRGFTQDDAHIFCTPDQLKDEVWGCVDFALYMMKTFGFHEYEVNLATRPDKFAGSSESWDLAEASLEEALKKNGIPFVRDEGGAVFYGPKIDIKLKDALGRLWQGPTIQFDFNLPGRFDVIYVGPDGKEHNVYMVHRALLGSLERFFGCLIEHYGGAFPLWLAPVQVRVLPITERNVRYAESVQKLLTEKKVRVDLNAKNEKIGAKIREAQLLKVPFMLIVGDEEEKDGTIAVRHFRSGDLGRMHLATLVSRLEDEIASRK